MNAEIITLREYCELAGYSYESHWVQKSLAKGKLGVGMLSAKKFGNSYMITVLKSWKDGKQGQS
jgi:hypothetical protein